jgi:hypothetical protein
MRTGRAGKTRCDQARRRGHDAKCGAHKAIDDQRSPSMKVLEVSLARALRSRGGRGRRRARPPDVVAPAQADLAASVARRRVSTGRPDALLRANTRRPVSERATSAPRTECDSPSRPPPPRGCSGRSPTQRVRALAALRTTSRSCCDHGRRGPGGSCARAARSRRLARESDVQRFGSSRTSALPEDLPCCAATPSRPDRGSHGRQGSVGSTVTGLRSWRSTPRCRCGRKLVHDGWTRSSSRSKDLGVRDARDGHRGGRRTPGDQPRRSSRVLPGRGRRRAAHRSWWRASRQAADRGQEHPRSAVLAVPVSALSVGGPSAGPPGRPPPKWCEGGRGSGGAAAAHGAA